MSGTRSTQSGSTRGTSVSDGGTVGIGVEVAGDGDEVVGAGAGVDAQPVSSANAASIVAPWSPPRSAHLTSRL